MSKIMLLVMVGLVLSGCSGNVCPFSKQRMKESAGNMPVTVENDVSASARQGAD